MRHKKHAIIYILCILLAVMCVAGVAVVWQQPSYEWLMGVYSEHALLAGVVFVLILCTTTVVAPITSLPLVPMMAPIMGPVLTAFLAIAGWTLGALIAFLIARYGGRPLIARYINMQALERIEQSVPKNMHFLMLVVLRVMLPVDLLSYVLGLVSTVSVIEYLGATVIGISWFAFAFAYLGEALLSGDYVLFGWMSVISALILVAGAVYVRQHMIR